MRNALSDDSLRDTGPKSHEDIAHKSKNRMYAQRYRDNAADVPQTEAIKQLELSRDGHEEPSRDFSSPKIPMEGTKNTSSKLVTKDGPKLSEKEVNLKGESLQRGELHSGTKPKKKTIDLKKARKKVIKKQQYKRLRFEEDPVSGTVKNGISSVAHQKMSDSSSNNASTEAFDEGSKLAEKAVRKVSSLRFESIKSDRYKVREKSSKDSEVARYSDKLRFEDEGTEVLKTDKTSRGKEQQKRAIKKRYAAKKRDSDTGSILTKKKSTATKDGGLGARLKEKVQNFVEDHKGAVAIAILIGFGIFVLMSSLTMCGSMGGGSSSVIFGTTYLATDEDIYAAEAIYCGLETDLQTQIDNIPTTYAGYDEYQYQIDEISHDPYALISYLTVMYGEFTSDQVTSEINDLFSQQYVLNIWETTETRTREVTRTETRRVRNPRTGQVETQTITYTETEEYEATILNVSLTNRGLQVVAFENLDEEEYSLYQTYQATCGNRRYLFGDPIVPPGISYEIPPDALSDERFARMIAEAEKYLGYPYVFGGSSPETSFDCSGFVSWVINHSDNGWNVGRQTASGLLNYVTYVSPAEAQPGDLIFFENTYDCDGPASHVAIYVGNGMMIHAGKPIQYASFETPYWQEHFLCFGRLP